MNDQANSALADIFGGGADSTPPPAASKPFPPETAARIASVKEVLMKSAPPVPAKVAPELITEPGVYQISNEEYHADPVAAISMTRGTIYDLINETPAHAYHKHPRLGKATEEEATEEEAEAKFDLGTAWHSLLFEGEQLAVLIDPKDHAGPKGGIPKGWTNDSIRKARDEARAAGKIPMLPKHHKLVTEMVAAAHRFLATCELGIKDLHAEGVAERTYVWKEDETWFRVRPDWISHKKFGNARLILDGKTVTQSASPDRFKPSEFGKDIQHSLYRRGVHAVDGGEKPRFLFLVQEAYAPYLCCLIGLDPQTQAMADEKVRYGKWLWEQCHREGEWPGYPTRPCYVETKPWEVAAWEQKAANLGQEE